MTNTVPLFLNRDEKQGSAALLQSLASVLPKNAKFGVYHVSTPPTKTTALCHPPPDSRPDRTYCEKHFLAITVDADSRSAPRPALSDDAPAREQVLVLAIEIYIFTTAFSTIIFVSKADSTGYLHLLGLPKGAPSPIREICTAFLGYLVEQRRREDIQLVVTLFARAQSQYLFPGSVKNSKKHVLDERGHVKWWCRVLDPLIEGLQQKGKAVSWETIHGYLIVPGLDNYETRAFIPRKAASASSWTVGHPLEAMSHFAKEYDYIPPRCLIPRYPDDPKSRFRDELDEESANWKQEMGQWKSVKTLDQFWELMAFRQECSSGRLTGFIWLVFNPKGYVPTSSLSTQATTPSLPTPTSSFDASLSNSQPVTPPRRIAGRLATTPRSSPIKRDASPSPSKQTESRPKKQARKKKNLSGPIVPRQPQVKTHQRNYLASGQISTAYYWWPPEGRGQRLVDETGYMRSVELLLHLDFATQEKALSSTRRWISETGMGSRWGQEVIGQRETPVQGTNGSAAPVNILSGLIKRKRPVDNETVGASPATADEPANKVNVLGTGLIRKKRKDDAPTDEGAPVESEGATGSAVNGTGEPAVTVLGAGLVRKKPKTA